MATRRAAGRTAFVVAALLTWFASSVTVSNAQPPSGLVAAYSFNEGAGSSVADVSGNNNTGTLGNGVTWTTQGKAGSALVFNGAGYVTIPQAASLNLTAAMTLEAWVYPTATLSGWRTVLMKEQASQEVYTLYAGSPASRPNVYFNTSTGSGERGLAGPSALALNAWSHLAGTYDGATLRLYVNGALVASQAYSGAIVTSTGALRIGGNAVWGEYFTGRIDEVRIYNRVLSLAEIQSDMNTAVGGPAPSDTTPPTVAITGPTTSPTYTTSASPLTVSGTAGDNVAVTQVTWANDRGGSGTAGGTTSWSAAGIALQSGTNVVTVTARDAAGNTRAATLTVTYTTSDTTVPTVSVTSPPAGATVSSTVTVAATASDNVGVVGVQFLLDGAPLGAERTTAPFSMAWNSTGTANGLHTISARARDAAGNTALAPNVSVTVSNTQPSSGLVAAYAFSEGAGASVADVSGNNNTGTLGSGVTWTTQGKAGSALVFNGAGYVTIPHAASLSLTSAMTLEAWVYPTATLSGWRTVLMKEQASQEVYTLYAGSPASRPNVYFNTSPGAGEHGVAGPSTLPLNAWSHLAGTYDGATLRLYVNGALVASQAYSGAIVTSTGALRIGGNAVWGEYFTGRIDDVRIYNRVLAQAEIQSDLNTPVGNPAPSDLTSPTLTITGPTTSPTYTTSSSPLTVSGTAGDNVAVTQVTWANDRGGSGTAGGTTSWSAAGIALQSGTNVVTVTARDAAGNTRAATLTVTYTGSDTTAPSVSVTNPTSSPTYATNSSPLTLGGSAGDNVSVAQVTWVNNRGGAGTASGTTIWAISGVTLQPGTNILTVTANDAAGNTGTATLTVSYDATPPTVAITTPTTGTTYTTNTSPMALGGTAGDNVGVTQVTWANDRSGSGIATGTGSWSVSAIALQAGTNVLTVTARDAANNSASAVLTVNYTASDTQPPTAPTGVTATQNLVDRVSLSWNAATDNIGVVAYNIHRSSTSGFSPAPANLIGQSAGLGFIDPATAGTYFYRVTAQDAAGNVSAPSTEATGVSLPGGMAGPLRRNTVNPRYFTDGTGRAIYLTGSHTWSNFVDNGLTDPPQVYDYTAWLDMLETNHHNFFRLWAGWEQAKWNAFTTSPYWFGLQPFARTGPGVAPDGKPKFNLTQFNQTYFDRLRQRVIEAGQRNMYVAVLLFNGWSVAPLGGGASPFLGHPMNAAYNVNGINGDPNGSNSGEEIHHLQIAAVTTFQEAFVRKVIDTINDLDNVTYEICNECDPDAVAWQYHMIDYIKAYQASLPKQHPVGMSDYPGGGGTQDLLNSPADWISPGATVTSTSKVAMFDTDHFCGVCKDWFWAWQQFMQGGNVMVMDGYGSDDYASVGHPGTDFYTSFWAEFRRNLGYIRSYADRVNLNAMAIKGSPMFSSGYGMANAVATNAEYLGYLPNGGSISIDLAATPGTLTVEWFNPSTGQATSGGSVQGGARRTLTAPFSGHAAVYVRNTP